MRPDLARHDASRDDPCKKTDLHTVRGCICSNNHDANLTLHVQFLVAMLAMELVLSIQ